jgi:hypothetical protein
MRARDFRVIFRVDVVKGRVSRQARATTTTTIGPGVERGLCLGPTPDANRGKKKEKKLVLLPKLAV